VNTSVTFITIDAESKGQRLDNYLFRELKTLPKTRIYNLLRRGEIRVNKGRKRADYKLCEHDVIRLPPNAQLATPAPIANAQQQQEFDRKFEPWIIHEDDRLLVINKPPGLAVHGGSGLHYGLIELIRRHRPYAKNWELVHRLDRDTSGLIMIAKKRSELRRLHQVFRDNRLEKIYWAVLHGELSKDVYHVRAALKKNQLAGGARVVRVDSQGQPSETIFTVCGRGDGLTWVQAKPITGRTHQIRVHAQSIGHWIIGDDRYGQSDVNQNLRKGEKVGLMLHARQLKVPVCNADQQEHMASWIAPPPAGMSALIRRWISESARFSD